MLKRGLNRVYKGALGALAASLWLMAPLSGETEVAAPSRFSVLEFQKAVLSQVPAYFLCAYLSTLANGNIASNSELLICTSK